MDSGRFDAFTRRLVTVLSRRGTLGALAAVLAMLLEPFAFDTSEAKKKKAKGCRKVGKKCSHKRNRRCCSHAKCRGGRCKCTGQKKACRGKCIPKSQCCDNADCGGGAICQGGVCNCLTGQKPCNGVCIPAGDCCTASDCGECESCQSGTCVSGCESGQECIAGTCRCTTTSCSGCCDDETCQPGDVPEVCGTDGESCLQCATNETCPEGECVCEAPNIVCGGNCVNPNSDDDHCGRCDNACVGSATCQGGACAAGGTYIAVDAWSGPPIEAPQGVAVDAAGNVYVTDTSDNQVVKFTSGGGVLDAWSSGGNGPLAVAVNWTSGSIYVANTFSSSLQPLASDGTPGTPWPLLGSPNGVVVNQSTGQVYVTIAGNDVGVQRFQGDGVLIESWLAPDYPFDFPAGIGIAPDGDVFIADNGTCEVLRFTADGDPEPGWGSCNGLIELDDPFGVAVDAAGDVYVCDSANQRVLKVTADGELIGQIGDDTNFEFPVGVAVSLAGYVYVVDSGNGNVQQFAPD